MEKSPVNWLRVKVCFITNAAILLQLQEVLKKGDETVTKLTTFAEERFQFKGTPFGSFCA